MAARDKMSKIQKILVVVLIIIVASPFFFLSGYGLGLVQKYVDKNKDADWAPKWQYKIARIHDFLGRDDAGVLAYDKYREMIEERRRDYLEDEDYPRAMFYKALAFDMSLKRKREAMGLYKEFIELFEDDTRTYVQRLVEKARRYLDRLRYGL